MFCNRCRHWQRLWRQFPSLNLWPGSALLLHRQKPHRKLPKRQRHVELLTGGERLRFTFVNTWDVEKLIIKVHIWKHIWEHIQVCYYSTCTISIYLCRNTYTGNTKSANCNICYSNIAKLGISCFGQVFHAIPNIYGFLHSYIYIFTTNRIPVTKMITTYHTTIDVKVTTYLLHHNWRKSDEIMVLFSKHNAFFFANLESEVCRKSNASQSLPAIYLLTKGL